MPLNGLKFHFLFIYCIHGKDRERFTWMFIVETMRVLNISKTTGCLKKKWDLFYDQYLRQIKHKSAGYIFDFKGGIHRPV